MRKYVSSEHLVLFSTPWDWKAGENESIDDALERLRHKDLSGYRVKTIRSGQMLECEIYPIWKTQSEAGRARKALASRPAQEKLNEKNAKKHIMRLVNTNFTNADCWGTFGYDDDQLPASPEEAKRDLVNFLRRIARRRKKLGLEPMKYLYVTEWASEDGEPVRCHHHVIMSGGMDRDEVESLWGHGAYPQVRRLRVKQDGGLNGLACYLAKNSRQYKRWGRSQNLKEPIISIADKKITARQVERMVRDQIEARELIAKKYPGYACEDMVVRFSPWVAGAYISVVMHKSTLERAGRRNL